MKNLRQTIVLAAGCAIIALVTVAICSLLSGCVSLSYHEHKLAESDLKTQKALARGGWIHQGAPIYWMTPNSLINPVSELGSGNEDAVNPK